MTASDRPGLSGFDPRVAKGHEEEAIALGEAEAVAMAKGEHIRSPLVIARGVMVLRQRAMDESGAAKPHGGPYTKAFAAQLQQHPGYLPLFSDDQKKAKRMITDGLWCLEHWTEVAAFIAQAQLALVDLNLSSLRVQVQKGLRTETAAADAEADDDEAEEAPPSPGQTKAEMQAFWDGLVARGLPAVLTVLTPAQVAQAIVATFDRPRVLQVVYDIEVLLAATPEPGPAKPDAAPRKRGRKPKDEPEVAAAKKRRGPKPPEVQA